MKYRNEFDSIGKIKVPCDKYWELRHKDLTNTSTLGFFSKVIIIHSIAMLKSCRNC